MKLPTNHIGTPVATTPTKNLLSTPIIVLLFLILLAILGGFYYWYTIVMSEQLIPTPLSRPTEAQNNEPESTTAEARTGVMNVVSTSDELDAIKADAETTNLTDLDSEVTPIESELDSALKAPP